MNNTNNFPFDTEVENLLRAILGKPNGKPEEFPWLKTWNVNAPRNNEAYNNVKSARRITTNKDKYVTPESQKEAFEKYCKNNNLTPDIIGFSKWLECDWVKTDLSACGGFAIGDMVIFDEEKSPYRICAFHSLGDDIYASVESKDEEGVRTTYDVKVQDLKKVELKPWDYATAKKYLGEIIWNKEDTETELIIRVKVGKDGKVYVNGRSTSELLSGGWAGRGFTCSIISTGS